MIFNVKLAKYFGLYQILNPKTGTLYGYNKFHVLSAFYVIVLLGIMSVVFVGVCGKVNRDPISAIVPLVVIQNVAFGCYKIAVVIRYSGDIWRCLDVTRYDFVDQHASETFKRFRSRGMQSTIVIFVAGYLALFLSLAVPLFFDHMHHVHKTTDEDEYSSIASYRYNMFNLIYPVSSDTYNDWFYVFYVCELIVGVFYLQIANDFDFLLIPVCLALGAQLETVGREYLSLGKRHDVFDRNSEINCMKITPVSIKNIKIIISKHQHINKLYTWARHHRLYTTSQPPPNICPASTATSTPRGPQARLVTASAVTKLGVCPCCLLFYPPADNGPEIFMQNLNRKMFDFYKITKPIIFIQIMFASITVIFLWFILTVAIIHGNSLFQILQMLTCVIYFTIQLLLPCCLFGMINYYKDSVNFAIYSSNWTDMDIECKKLILFAMRMNNANYLRMRITPTKVVNMEIFRSAIHTCFSILSVMLELKLLRH